MPTILKGTQIAVDQMSSAEANNLLRYNGNGLHFALAAPPNLTNQFVSSSMGNDNNDGTRASPLKTIAKAVERLPDGTTGYIWLYETDTFPLRGVNDPTTWGTAINYYGSQISTGTRSIQFIPYGPQHDYYDQVGAGAVLFAGWLLQEAPRPIIEIGHYMYNGKPVGCGMVMGAYSGQAVYLHGCDIRVTTAARNACASTNTAWTATGNQAFFLGVTAHFRGCKLPDPIVAGGVTTRIAIAYQDIEFWQCAINSGSSSWLAIGGTAIVDVNDSGPTIYDGQGVGRPSQTNTVIVDIAARTDGVVKDSNGIARNVYSNVTF